MDFLKKLAARLPRTWQQELKRYRIRSQIRRGRFNPGEPEYDLLPTLVQAGDWVIDVGANVGHYTVRLSELVGPEGRVIAFEPVSDTLELLAAVVARLADPNVTLLNAAASDASRLAGMEVPKHGSGLENFYMAHLSDSNTARSVMCVPIDALDLAGKVTLVKIDAEGHELPVLRGMVDLLRRDRPTLIVEDSGTDVVDFLATLGYRTEKLPGSSNRLFRHRAR